jgi:hypothetical protein
MSLLIEISRPCQWRPHIHISRYLIGIEWLLFGFTLMVGSFSAFYAKEFERLEADR